MDCVSGMAEHWIALGGVVRELHDIACIPGKCTPMAVGFAQDPINRLIRRGGAMSLADLLGDRP